MRNRLQKESRRWMYYSMSVYACWLVIMMISSRFISLQRPAIFIFLMIPVMSVFFLRYLAYKKGFKKKLGSITKPFKGLGFILLGFTISFLFDLYEKQVIATAIYAFVFHSLYVGNGFEAGIRDHRLLED